MEATTAIETLRERIVGRRIVELRGHGDSVSAIRLDDGTVLRFNWWVGADDEYVGLRIGRPAPEPPRRWGPGAPTSA
ncbi:MAG: hypothetical protein ACYDCI_00425 [Candidatus Limnocylindrales bacterium]